MKVLSLVPNEESPIYKKQEKILTKLGINTTTVSVPGQMPRTSLDYLSFYPKIVKNAFHRYDLVHANFGLTAPFALAQPQRPLIITLWGTDRAFFLGDHRWSWFGRNVVRLELFDEIMVRSEEMRRELKEEFGLNSHIVPTGVDLGKFKPMEKEEAKKHVGWDLDVKHILFLASPSRDVKNYQLAKEVSEEVKKRIGSKVELKVVHGVPHEKIPLYFNASEVLLLTSKSEGSPNTVKEALACDVPVVSTDVGDVELLLDGVKFSEVCENKEELVEGVIDAINSDTSPNGRERIRELGISIDDMGKKILNVYQQALDR